MGILRTHEQAHEVGIRACEHVDGQLGRQVARQWLQERGLERRGRRPGRHGLLDCAELALCGLADRRMAAARRLRMPSSIWGDIML